MSLDFERLSQPGAIARMPNHRLQATAASVLGILETDRQENALRYYKPASAGCLAVHQSTARKIGVFGGNGSSKTECSITQMISRATGILPDSLRDEVDPAEWFRGPIQCRVICESLTTTLHTIILAKLKWWVWTGIDQPGGERGHWGWVPKSALVKQQWDLSWSEKLRLLTLHYFDPKDPTQTKVIGTSTIQFMSHDQDPSDFASGDFHEILFDEPSNKAIWRENEARTMRVDGRIVLAMTWPDDPAISVDWIYDEVYEPGTKGPNKDHNIDCFQLDTTENPFLDQEAIARQMGQWTDETVRVRIRGESIRFSNRIHPLFTDQTHHWCFDCGRGVALVSEKCTCGSQRVAPYNHVREFESSGIWPTVWLLDPHPRKPHMWSWWQIDPKDDLWCVAEGELASDPVDVAAAVFHMERELGLHVSKRLIDPNMGRTPSGTRREVVWQDEFDGAGLVCDLADDSDVGRGRINQMLRPDDKTLQPRMHWHPRCEVSIQQMKRYQWDDYRKALEKDVKQKPKAKYDDYPTLAKYLLNEEPTFHYLHQGAPILNQRRAAGGR